MSVTWTREGGAEVFYAALVDQEGSEFRLSPFYAMLSEANREWRLRLDHDAIERFPLLMQLKAKGFTDYLALVLQIPRAFSTCTQYVAMVLLALRRCPWPRPIRWTCGHAC